MSEGTPKGEFAVKLPFSPEAAQLARSLVARLLAEHDCADQLVEDGRLVVHELVMNGVRHGEPDARTQIAVACRVLAEHVVISVRDHGRKGAVVARHASPEGTHGRGLVIVEALSERWSVDRNGGTRVEAWLPR